MKKFFCLFFVVCQLNLFAQDCELPVFNREINTGNNLTMMLTDAFIDGIAFMSDNPYIVVTTEGGLVVGSSCISDACLGSGGQGLAVWGDDSMTSEIDGAVEGEIITLKLVDDYHVFYLETPLITYASNGIVILRTSVIQNFECTGYVSGCLNPGACNYDSSVTLDDGSCEYPETYYDCSGLCLGDADGDGTCDELEVMGCEAPMACNYNPVVTEDNGSCTFAQQYYNCQDECLNDTDGDAICDELELVGCMDSIACNYNPVVTEDNGSCIYPQQYSDCNVQCLNDTDGDGICDELEIVGCTEPMACNYEPTATDEGSCEYFGIDSCNVSLTEVNRSDFKLYPNPGNDRINIQSAHKQERLEISMTNILGANLLYRSLNNVHPSDLIEVHLPALPSGVYTVTFSSSSEKSSIRWIKK